MEAGIRHSLKMDCRAGEQGNRSRADELGADHRLLGNNVHAGNSMVGRGRKETP